MMLQKLALLWMLEDQDGKLNRPEKRKIKEKERKIPLRSRKLEAPPEAHGAKPFALYC